MALTPDESLINDRIIERNIHNRFDAVIVVMLIANTESVDRVEADIDVLTRFPGKKLHELDQDEITGARADAIVVDELAACQDKRTRLLDKQFLMEQEQAFRRDGKVTRTPVN